MKKIVPTLIVTLSIYVYCHAQSPDVKLDKINPSGWPFVWTLTMDADSNLYAGDETGKLWIKTKGSALWIRDNSFNVGSTEIRGISVFAKNDIWVCTDSKGLVHYDGSTWTIFDKTTGLPSDDDWRKSIKDKAGNYWFSSRDIGVAKLSGINWTYYNNTNSKLKFNVVDDILQSKDGTVWVASYEQVLSFKNGVWKEYDFNGLFGYSTLSVNSMYEDPSGKLWACTTKGLFAFENNAWASKQSISDAKEVQVMAIDKKGTIWYLLYGVGLVRYTSVSKQIFEGSTTNDIPSQAWVMLVNGNNEKLLVGNQGSNMIVVNDDALSTSILDVKYEDIAVYPNPSTDYIYFKGKSIDYRFEIFNAQGQVTMEGSTSDNRINVTKLSSGQYQILLKSESSQYHTTFTKI